VLKRRARPLRNNARSLKRWKRRACTFSRSSTRCPRVLVHGRPESEELLPHAKAVALRIRGVDAVCGSKSRFWPRTARRRTCFRQSPAGKRWHFNDLKS
jgi:hypothetical protein